MTRKEKKLLILGSAGLLLLALLGSGLIVYSEVKNWPAVQPIRVSREHKIDRDGDHQFSGVFEITPKKPMIFHGPVLVPEGKPADVKALYQALLLQYFRLNGTSIEFQVARSTNNTLRIGMKTPILLTAGETTRFEYGVIVPCPPELKKAKEFVSFRLLTVVLTEVRDSASKRQKFINTKPDEVRNFIVVDCRISI